MSFVVKKRLSNKKETFKKFHKQLEMNKQKSALYDDRILSQYSRVTEKGSALRIIHVAEVFVVRVAEMV